MSQPKFCQNCEFWTESYKNSDGQFGTCNSPVVEGKVLVDYEEKLFEDDTTIHTIAHFGCIYHTPTHGNIVAKIELDL